MIPILTQWYMARTLRERWLLGAMASIAVPMLIWLAVVIPLTGAYQHALAEHLAAADRNGRVLMLAEQARQGGGSRRTAISNADLSLAIGDSARRAGLELESSNSVGASSVAISLANVAPSAALVWLTGLEREGYRVDSLRVTPSGPGAVTATAQLTRVGQ